VTFPSLGLELVVEAGGADDSAAPPARRFAIDLLGARGVPSMPRWLLPPTPRERLVRAQVLSAVLAGRSALDESSEARLVASFIGDWTWASTSSRIAGLFEDELRRAGSADPHADARAVQAAIAKFWIDGRLLAATRDIPRSRAGVELLRRLAKQPDDVTTIAILTSLIRTAPRLVFGQAALLIKVLRRLSHTSGSIHRCFDALTWPLLEAIGRLHKASISFPTPSLPVELIELAAAADGHPGLLFVATRWIETQVRGGDLTAITEDDVRALKITLALMPSRADLLALQRSFDTAVDEACVELERLCAKTAEPLEEATRQLQRLRRLRSFADGLDGAPEMDRVRRARRTVIERSVARLLPDGAADRNMICEALLYDASVRPQVDALDRDIPALLHAYRDSPFAPADPIGFLFFHGKDNIETMALPALVAPLAEPNESPVLRRLERQAWLWSWRNGLEKSIVAVGAIAFSLALLNAVYHNYRNDQLDITFRIAMDDKTDAEIIGPALYFIENAGTDDERREALQRRLAHALSRRALQSEADAPSAELLTQVTRYIRAATPVAGSADEAEVKAGLASERP